MITLLPDSSTMRVAGFTNRRLEWDKPSPRKRKAVKARKWLNGKGNITGIAI